MNRHLPHSTIGLLLSGGIDSSILLAHLLESGRTVQPIHIRTGVAWELEEYTAIHAVLSALRSPRLLELVSLELPLDDLYANHWSMTGNGVPGEDSSDEAVYMPGRNPLLLVKAAVWCQIHGVGELALAPLASNPFADATDDFFAAFERAFTLAGNSPLRIVRPLAGMSKREVMQLRYNFPLEHTFSCIAPRDGLHCGRCNKCGERKSAFEMAGRADLTQYADQPRATPHQRVYL